MKWKWPLTALTLLVSSCDRPVAKNADSDKQPETQIRSDVDRAEVLKQAESKWKDVWIQHNDTWIARAKEHPYLLQIKGRQTEVRPESLTEADRLNEIQWHGTVIFSCVAERKFAFESNANSLSAIYESYRPGWNEWATPEGMLAVYRFKKQHDTWALLENGPNEIVQFQFGRGDMIRPTSAELRKSGIDKTSPDGREGTPPPKMTPSPSPMIQSSSTTDEPQKISQRFVGTWRSNASISTFAADGTLIIKFYTGKTRISRWSVSGNILTEEHAPDHGKVKETYRIISISNSEFTLQGDSEWRGTRVK